jgi:hypothetical protein
MGLPACFQYPRTSIPMGPGNRFRFKCRCSTALFCCSVVWCIDPHCPVRTCRARDRWETTCYLRYAATEVVFDALRDGGRPCLDYSGGWGDRRWVAMSFLARLGVLPWGCCSRGIWYCRVESNRAEWSRGGRFQRLLPLLLYFSSCLVFFVLFTVTSKSRVLRSSNSPITHTAFPNRNASQLCQSRRKTILTSICRVVCLRHCHLPASPQEATHTCRLAGHLDSSTCPPRA